jgi:hypothetical protein
MSEAYMLIDTLPNLYSITGRISDINTLLINRDQLKKLMNINSDSELLKLINGVTYESTKRDCDLLDR